MFRRRVFGLIPFFALLASRADAEVVEIGPSDDLQGSINALGPGDELVLQGGVYSLSYRLSIQVSGTEQAPIVIRSKDGETAIIEHDASQNTINVENNQHVVLRGLEVRSGSHGIRISAASFITVEDCHIHDTADVGLSANVGGSSYEGLRLLRNHIHDTGGTGEGMYLGCNYDGCRMFDSLIEGNYIHHTNGPSVSQGDGIEIKEGSHDNVVRDNVIHDTGHPCILTYGVVGNGGPNVLERNVMWHCGDHAIQAAADAVIRNNIILGAAADGIRNQPHQSASPGNLVIVHNTILMPAGGGSALRSDSIVGSVLIANNALYAESGNALQVGGSLGSLVVAGNVGMGGTQGVSSGFSATGALGADFVSASFSGATPNDLFPAAGSALVAAGDATHVADDDFNGTPRAGVADVGAYRFDASGNPGWTLGGGFKDDVGGSGGSGGTGGSGTGGFATGGSGTGATGTGGSGTGATGTGGSGTGATGTGGSGASTGAASPGTFAPPPEEEDGCGCRLAGDGPSNRAGWLAGLALAVGRLRRRRRR